MNKKNLSVVLAGAMLATSVAPVLADTTTATEYSLDNIELLNKEIVDKMESMLLTNNTALLEAGNKYLNPDVIALLNANRTSKVLSVYGVKVLDKDGKEVLISNEKVSYNVNNVKSFLTSTNIKNGYTIQLVKRGYTEFFGELIPGTQIEKGVEEGTYTKEDFTSTAIGASGKTYKDVVINTATNKILDSSTPLSVSPDGSVLTVKTNKLNNISDATDGKLELTYDVNSTKIDGRLPLTSDGKLLDYTKEESKQKFDHFETLSTWTKSNAYASEPTVESSYKMTAVTEDENTLKASDLYDGIALTAKGTEIASDLINAAKEADSTVATPGTSLVKLGALNTSTDAPIYKFTVTYNKNATTTYKTLTIYSSSKTEITALYNLLKTGSFKVGVVGGDNRYETAVNIAKAQEVKVFTKGQVGNIVLVNGDSLVDGLSAAPLAAELVNGTDAAPILLTKADKLPESTKEYIKELIKNQTSKAEKRKVVVSLVGGKSVLSEELVSELEDMGLSVVRYGGANREATSLKVAEKLANAGNKAFVVGGNGEADAMAISAVAAKAKAPIIVSSVNGISQNALTYINENLAKANITVVGGESVVSADELNAINDSLSLNKASRVAGENRFETNAKIIEEFYSDASTDAKAIVLAKDGQSNKGELVDALASANYAVKLNAPIVLASKSLSDVQKSVLVNKLDFEKDATNNKVVQVGQGAERSILETVAKLFNINN